MNDTPKYDSETLKQLQAIEVNNKLTNLTARILALENLKIAQELWIFAGEIKELKKKSLEKPRLVERIKKIIN